MSLGNPERPVGALAVRTPAGIELRPTGRDDLTVAVELAREGRGLGRLPSVDPIRDRYEALVNHPDTAAFVALADGHPTGLAVAHFRRRLNFATFEGWISELYVTAAGSQRGVDRSLVEAVAAEWRLRRGHRLLAAVEHGDEAGPLEAAGFEEAFLNFRLAPVRAEPKARVPPGLRIRSLGPQDAERVTRLIAEFGPRRSPVPERMDAVLRTFADHVREVEKGTAASRVAEMGGEVIGVCTTHWQLPFWTPEIHAWVADLVVTEPMRGRGVGRALMADALSLARGRGASRVDLESGAQRQAAHSLYRSMGFVDSGRTWVLSRDA
ncbi:MAG TPA: GNAT family N-acetyltransferase [Candidatus Limnocylindria bacterium]|nr:GNAT family N-acetyltransferase [Candidatus Limnocylindria bacterium]